MPRASGPPPALPLVMGDRDRGRGLRAAEGAEGGRWVAPVHGLGAWREERCPSSIVQLLGRCRLREAPRPSAVPHARRACHAVHPMPCIPCRAMPRGDDRAMSAAAEHVSGTHPAQRALRRRGRGISAAALGSHGAKGRIVPFPEAVAMEGVVTGAGGHADVSAAALCSHGDAGCHRDVSAAALCSHGGERCLVGAAGGALGSYSVQQRCSMGAAGARGVPRGVPRILQALV